MLLNTSYHHGISLPLLALAAVLLGPHSSLAIPAAGYADQATTHSPASELTLAELARWEGSVVGEFGPDMGVAPWTVMNPPAWAMNNVITWDSTNEGGFPMHFEGDPVDSYRWLKFDAVVYQDVAGSPKFAQIAAQISLDPTGQMDMGTGNGRTLSLTAPAPGPKGYYQMDASGKKEYFTLAKNGMIGSTAMLLPPNSAFPDGCSFPAAIAIVKQMLLDPSARITLRRDSVWHRLSGTASLDAVILSDTTIMIRAVEGKDYILKYTASSDTVKIAAFASPLYVPPSA